MTEKAVPARRLEARRRVNQRRPILERQAAARAETERAARAGEKVPAATRITCSLDLRALYGPQVDAALGVLQDPPDVVDRWEAGTLVPTWDEIVRLAELTDMLPEWFYGPELPDTGPVFVCKVR